MIDAMDPRWSSMVELDLTSYQPKPFTFEHLENLSIAWSQLLPANLEQSGALTLLKTSRNLFKYSWFDYDFMVIACLVSIQALEVAFYDANPNISKRKFFSTAIKSAVASGDLDAQDAEIMEAGRRLRNSLSHPKTQSSFSIGMATPVIERSHMLVAKLLSTKN